MSDPVTVQSGKKACEGLYGQVLRIPSMTSTFAEWPAGTNKHLDELRAFVDKLLESAVSSHKDLARLKRCDFAWFTALWYPFIELEELRPVAAFCVWLFTWDDTMDMADGEFASSLERAASHSRSTLEFISWSLALDGVVPPTKQPPGSTSDCSAATTKIFGYFAEAMCEHATLETRKQLYDEVEVYITQVLREHELTLRGQLPTPEDYIECRLGTSGSYTLTAFLDFATRTKIPASIMDSKEMKALRYEENIMTILMNDLYSLKKEIAHGSFVSLVPAAWYASSHRDLDQIVGDLMDRIDQSALAFDKAAEDLEKLAAKENGDLVQDVRKWIETSRTLLSGCLEYHLRGERYGIERYLLPDGSASIPLSLKAVA